VREEQPSPRQLLEQTPASAPVAVMPPGPEPWPRQSEHLDCWIDGVLVRTEGPK
jgi:hypothetical protein